MNDLRNTKEHVRQEIAERVLFDLAIWRPDLFYVTESEWIFATLDELIDYVIDMRECNPCSPNYLPGCSVASAASDEYRQLIASAVKAELAVLGVPITPSELVVITEGKLADLVYAMVTYRVECPEPLDIAIVDEIRESIRRRSDSQDHSARRRREIAETLGRNFFGEVVIDARGNFVGSPSQADGTGLGYAARAAIASNIGRSPSQTVEAASDEAQLAQTTARGAEIEASGVPSQRDQTDAQRRREIGERLKKRSGAEPQHLVSLLQSIGLKLPWPRGDAIPPLETWMLWVVEQVLSYHHRLTEMREANAVLVNEVASLAEECAAVRDGIPTQKRPRSWPSRGKLD